jgi:arylsulfatase A-like enzyme
VATSDHGDMDGHHKLIYKGPFMYDQMMRVPLIIKLPPAYQSSVGHTPIPGKTDFPTVNVDLAPTLADFAGLPLTGPNAINGDGISLKSLLTGEGAGQVDIPGREFVVGQYYSKQKWVNPIRMICTDRYKYNIYCSGKEITGEELYDLKSDPDEIHNRAGEKQLELVRSELREKLEDWMKENNDPFYTQKPTDRMGKEKLCLSN